MTLAAWLWPFWALLSQPLTGATRVEATAAIASDRSQGYASQLAIAACGDDLAATCGALKLPRLGGTNYDATTCSDDGGTWTCQCECAGYCSAAEDE